ncbi:stAR-related lipid transfer protein 9 [Bufo gargarizans]|uniref:stAR-related lipid transfer protein 9 n=1 Tax=Bufo gargarizans TaxID=30331 RepID=UPI001CF290BF|nr:stAR-related lipid transfer protein 9 [Bufo gargarizans]
MANVKVALRVRPLSKREHAEEARVIVNVDEKIARIRNIKLDYKPESGGDTRERLSEFGFDYCYWSVDPEDPKYASQEVIFQDLGTTVLSEAISGYNVCLFAYGQTGSGKTYTMMGTPASIGLTPRICEGLFSYNDGSPGTPSSSRIEVSFLEIYNERVRDLLHQSDQKKPYTLRVREHPEKGPYVQGLSQHVVTDYEQVVGLLEQGIENRITAATHVHDASSRSHAIFTIQYTQASLEDNLPSEIASKINLVDLAGSERASPNYCKDRLTEGSNINRSLVTLGIVISALAQNSQMSSSCQSINSILSDGDSGIPSSPSGSSATGSKRQPFVPYRDSILTWLLKDSLGGNSKTIMIATVSPASSSYNETISTLRYASNAKNIINKPRVNENANVKLIRELREEINRLKAMLRNFEMRTSSPSFNEERDGNLTELVLLNELKIEQLTKDWTDKWTDKAAFMEQYNVDINEGKARVTIDSGLPHLIAMDDDILSTGVVIYYLKEGTTHIGNGDHDIVLQCEDVQEEHCVIENKLGVVELRPSLGALCRVNGQEVKDVCRLSQGAIIVLGKSHRFRFNHPAEAAVLRQKRSDSQASFVSDCSLDWLDLSGDFSSSSKGNSLILNTRNSESPSEEYQQGLRGLGATYRKQIEEQQQYVEDLKSQIQTAQVKGEKELEHEQSLINQQVQEYEQWLVKEKERLSAVCQQKRESSSQTEAKTYVEAEVQNCVQTDIQPSLEEQEGKKLVQLELIRKCSLRRAERNIRRKRVKLQLERIVKKQKLLEAKKTLQQLQAACWLSDDIVKPTLLHVPKVQETSAGVTALHRSSSSPSGFSFYRRCSLPWTLQALPNTYSAVLKRKCKSELTHTTKNDVSNPLRSVSIDCLLNSSDNPGSNEQLENNPFSISTKNLQFVEEKRIDLLIKQISAGAAFLSSDPQMSKKRQKMDKPRGGSKGSSNNSTAEQPKRRNIRANVSTGTKDTKPKPLKSPSPLTVGGPKKSTVQEKSKLSPKSDVGKPPPQKSVKHTQISPGQVKPPLGESTIKGKPVKYNMASIKSNTQRKPAEQVNKVSSSINNISKIANRRGENQTSNRGRISTERPNRVLLKANIQTLEDCKDNHTDSSDSESFYSVDSLSSAYASALAEQLKQEDLQRQRSNNRQKDSDSEDSQMSQDSLAEKEKRKERPNKRRFNKYKTIEATSPTTSFAGEHNSFPLVTTGSVMTGLSKSFSLDSLADAEDVLEADSSEELPAEIFWKLQSPRSLILNEEDKKKENIAGPREDSGLDISNSFYLKVNDGPTPDYCDVSLPREMEYHPAILSNICDGTSQTISLSCDSISSSSGLSTQTDTVKPNENTVHGDALSPAFASKIRVSFILKLPIENLCNIQVSALSLIQKHKTDHQIHMQLKEEKRCKKKMARKEIQGEDEQLNAKREKLCSKELNEISLVDPTEMCDGKYTKTSEDECSKKGSRDVCLHHYESALCTTEEENTNLESKDEDNLSNARSLCNMRSDTLQDPASEYFNKNVFPRDQNEEGAIKNCAKSEMVELVTENAHARHCIEDNMYQPTCSTSSLQDLSADQVYGERDCNLGMTNDLSSPMRDRKVCKVVCELEQFCDQNLAQPAHSNRVDDQVTCPVVVGDKENGELEEKCLITEVCGEYSSDLSDSTDISSSDTDTSRYLVMKNVTGVQNRLVNMLTGCEPNSSVSKKDINEISQSATSEEEMSPSMDSIKTPSPEHPNVLDQMDSTESDTNEFSPSPVGTLLSRSNSVGRFMKEHSNLEIKSEVCAQDNMTDHHTQTVQSPYHTTNYSVLMEDVVDNAESLHFSSSDINPFVHSWQQEGSPKPGWRHCTFNSASDVSCAEFREQADKLMRCSSVDEGLNSHNSPFHSHLSSYANAKAVSTSTISSLGRNDSRPDITSLDDSQELLSDESAVICTGNRAEFTGISGLETKFEDHSQLDEIIFLYTSESETCNEPVKQVSGEQGPHIKHKHRKTSRHQRNHTEICPSEQMRNKNICQRPASCSSVQSMSLHLSQLLQETSELLGNLSKHHPENVRTEDIKMQRDCEDHIMKRSVRDSSTQTSVDKGIQTDSHIVKNAQKHTSERKHFLSTSGINVIVKVLGTDSLTHIPQKTEQSKVTKTRTQSLPNLHEFELSKQSERVVYHSPQVRASIPLLTGSQDKSSTAFPYSSSKSSSVSTNVNKCAEDLVVHSPSSSAVDTARYHTSYYEKTAMVDRASSPILTVKASNKFHYKLVRDNHLNYQNFAKILRNRKRKERELRDLQLNSSQTETDSESNAGNEYEAARSSSLKETTRKKVSSAKFQRFVSEGCILRDADSFTNQSSSNSEITSSEKKCNGVSHFTAMHGKKARHPWEHLQSLQNLSLMSQTVTSRDEQILRQSPKEFISDKNDLGSFTITSGNSYNKNRSYSPSQISGFDLHLQEDGLSVVESECNTDILLGLDPALRTCQKPHGYVLHDLPMHNKFSNWSGVQCGSTKNGMVSSSPNLNMRGSPTKTGASQEALDSRSQEIERLQKERAEVLSAIHLEMNPLPLTVQLAEAKLSYGIGETDALLRVLQTGKMDPQDTVSIKKQLYERHLKMIENVRKEREERLQRFRRSRSLSPQKQLSASQTSLTSLRESDLPSRRREYLQQLRRDVVDNTRIQEPKSRALQCPSEIEVMLKDYQKAREEAKTEIAKARDKLRERAEMERRRLQQGSLTKDDTKMKTLVSTSTLFTNSSLSLSSGPTSGYNSGMTATIGQGSKLSSQETLLRSLDPALGSGRGRSAVRNYDLFTATSISVPDSHRTSSSTAESLPGKSIPCSPQRNSLLQSTAVAYQELATRVQASAMAEVMTACSYDVKKLYNHQAAAGWIYQSTEKDVLVYYKAFSSPTKHGFIGAGVIKRPMHDVWCTVKDISARRLYDQSILTACVHERMGSNIQLVHVMTDTSLCYLKQPRDFCCLAVEYKQEKCYSLCFQSVYNESMPRPNKDTVRGELLPSAWILQPDTINGEAITRVIYMVQVDLGAPAIPSRLLNVISKRQPLVIANLASFLSR